MATETVIVEGAPGRRTFLATPVPGLDTVPAVDYPVGFPGGLALDGHGNVYIADFDRERVAKYRLLPPLAPE